MPQGPVQRHLIEYGDPEMKFQQAFFTYRDIDIKVTHSDLQNDTNIKAKYKKPEQN